MGETNNLDAILDLPVSEKVQLGRTKMFVGDILNLNQGKIIELDKIVRDPLEVFVGETLVATGEVVISHESYAVRVVDITTPRQRVERLGKQEIK